MRASHHSSLSRDPPQDHQGGIVLPPEVQCPNAAASQAQRGTEFMMTAF
jgi:hypothetical protein